MDEILKRIQWAKSLGAPAAQQEKQWMPGMRLPPLPAVKTVRDTTQQMGGVSSGALPSLGIGRETGGKRDGIMARIEREKESISATKAQREDTSAQKMVGITPKMSAERHRNQVIDPILRELKENYKERKPLVVAQNAAFRSRAPHEERKAIEDKLDEVDRKIIGHKIYELPMKRAEADQAAFYEELDGNRRALESVRGDQNFQTSSDIGRNYKGTVLFPWNKGVDVEYALTYLAGDDAFRRNADENKGFKYKNLDRMTDAEKSTLYYYVGKNDMEKAGAYLDAVQRDLNARGQQAQSAETERLSREHPILFGVPANVGGSFGAPAAYVANTGTAVKNALTGGYEQTDVNSPAFHAAHMVDDSARGVHTAAYEDVKNATGSEDAGNVAAFLAGGGLSIGQMVSKMPFGPLALPLMGASVSGTSTMDALERGATPNQALAEGTSDAIVEILTEKLPVDDLFRIAKFAPKGAKEVVKNILKQMGSEGGQEVISELVDNLADSVIMGDKSEYERYVQTLMEQGADEQTARAAATKQFYISNVAKAGLGGALSGGVMAGGASVVGKARSAGNTDHTTETGKVAPTPKKTREYDMSISEDGKFHINEKAPTGEYTSNRDQTQNTTQYPLEKPVTPQMQGDASTENVQQNETTGWRRDTMPAKADAYLTKAQSQTLGKLGEALSVPKQASREFLRPAMEELTKEYMENGSISKETADRLFETAYDNGIMVDDDYYNTYKDLKEELRTFPVTLSATDKADIEDYAAFRRANMGKVRIVNEGGLPVDVRYQELTEKHPELFPEQLTHPADQLRKMAEVAEGIHKTERELNAYYGAEAETFRKFAKAEFDKVLEDFTPELERVKRYSDERAKEQQKKEENMNFAAANIDGDAAAIREAWAAVKPLKKAAERATNENLLTKQDKGTVDRLLKGEMTLEDVAAGANLKGIKAVYEAKKAYRDAMGPILQFNSGRKDALRTEAGELIGDVTELKDKGAGILYSRETMERNIRDVIKNKKTAQTVIDRYFAPVHKNEAKRTKLKNKMRDRVRELNLSRKVQKGNEVSEAAAVQIYGETASALEMIENSRGRKEQRDGESYDDLKAKMTELIEKNPKMDWDKVRNSVEQFRGIYNELFERMNSARIANGYEPVDYRAGYFPHFSEKGGDGILDQFAAALGITMEVQNLPTTINGITHTFRPGIRWSGNILQRTGNKTAYDALEGFDMYVESISDIIMHTGDIQALRALSDEIRYKASDDGIKEQVDAVRENAELDELDKRNRINEIYGAAPTALSNLVVELEEYTNLLANKKSRRDRMPEGDFGRIIYDLVKAVENRVAGNMVAINPGSWLTNFIPLVQGGAELRANNLLSGMWDTLKAMKQDDGFAASSTFLTNRVGSEPLVRDFWEGISAKAGHGMEIIDQFTANSLVRARCKNNVQDGMERADALKEADTWTAEVMADRSKGSTPTLFQAKNPFLKLFTMFQLEVNNQMSYLLKDIPGRDKNKALKLLAGVLLKFFIGSFLFNEAYEALVGRRPALDPIGMLNDTVGDFTGYELPNLAETGIGLVNHQLPSLKTTKKTAAQAVSALKKRAVEELPFVGGILGGGRLPITSALPDMEAYSTAKLNLKTGEGDPDKQRYIMRKELAKPGYYVLPPFGGGQLKKIFEGAEALKKGGSYSVNANGQDIMQYPVYRDGLPQLVGNAAKIAVFGKSSMPEARNWVESGFKSSSAPATSSYQALLRAGANGKDAYDAVRAVSAADKVAERMAALDGSKLTNAEKSAVYYGMLANDTEVELIDQLDEAGEDLGGIYEALGGIRNAGTLKGAAASNAKRNAVAGANLSDEAKIAVYRAKISDTRDDDIKAVLGAGLTFDEYLEAETKKETIGESQKSAEEKSVELSRWVKSKGYTDDEREAIRKAFQPKTENIYDELAATGLPDKLAYGITQKIGELHPKLGKKSVSQLQKSRVIVDADMSNVDKVAALGAVMDDTELAKLDTVWEQYKVPPAQYVRYKEKLDAIDINGSITQEEAQRAMEGLVLTREQKAALYQVQNKSWKPWKNPYSTIAAEKTLNAYTRVKKQSGEEIAKQLKGLPTLPPVKSQISFTGPEKTAGTLTPEERLKKMMLPEVGKQ